MTARTWLSALAALGLAVAAAGQQDSQEPRQDRRAQARQARDRALQAAVDRLVVLVEKHAGLAFVRPPRVRAATHKEWREIVAEAFELESPGDIVTTSIQTLGLYRPETDDVVLSPLVVAPLVRELGDDPPRHLLLAVAHQRATVVHELVHALQQQHFGLPGRLEASDDDDETLALKYVVEGHAVLIEERIAEREFGLEDYMLTGSYGGFSTNFSYTTGRRYFLHRLRTGGMEAVLQSLREPPTFDELVELANQELPPEREAKDRPVPGHQLPGKPGGQQQGGPERAGAERAGTEEAGPERSGAGGDAGGDSRESA